MAVLGSDNITHSADFKFNLNSSDRVIFKSTGESFFDGPIFSGTTGLGLGKINSYGPLQALTTGNVPAASNIRFAKTRGTSMSSQVTVSNGDELGYIDFLGSDGTSYKRACFILCTAGSVTTGSVSGVLSVATTFTGDGEATEVLRINNGHSVNIKTTSSWIGANSRANIDYIGGGTQFGLTFRTASGGQSRPINFLQGGGINGTGSPAFVGSITTDTTSTAFNTSSDYRLKENFVSIENAISRLKQLSVYRFNFINEPERVVDGFIAHEAQEVVPECVTGIKDEVDEKGNPVYQGIDQSKIVPLLTAALQEAIKKIETLETKVEQLEAI
jgi:hypothetical protein